ncbi:EthD domain-containing protein [Paenarthrobacter nicotinovorans]|uniref:EthD domain-containing protein n=1 Tax=Paenarthrobacter nicotinovorans TaxID=29320 RepID=UPI0038262D43
MSDNEVRPVRTMALLGRKPGMSYEQFRTYWRDVHAPMAAKLPGVTRYIQRHIMPDVHNGEPDNEFGIDGVVILEYESQDAMEAAWASEAGQAAMADVPNFLGKHSVIVLDDHVVIDNT